jgi:hypothetical protein
MCAVHSTHYTHYHSLNTLLLQKFLSPRYNEKVSTNALFRTKSVHEAEGTLPAELHTQTPTNAHTHTSTQADTERMEFFPTFVNLTSPMDNLTMHLEVGL